MWDDGPIMADEGGVGCPHVTQQLLLQLPYSNDCFVTA